MQNLKILLFTAILITSFTSIGSILNTVKAISSDYLDDEYIFGPIAGLSENETGSIDWVMVGNWRSSLDNNTVVQENQSSNAFNAAIEMVKSDGTARHTHTLTDFVVLNVSSPNGNSTFYNGTSTISLQEGPAVDIPTSIVKSNNDVVTISIDPESVDHHFGELPLFGVTVNPEIFERPHMINNTNNNTPDH